MKADIFVLYCCGVIAALFAYVFVGGIVLRAFNASRLPYSPIRYTPDKGIAVALWPLLLWMSMLILLSVLLLQAYGISQWRPRRKSQLPGARVVR